MPTQYFNRGDLITYISDSQLDNFLDDTGDGTEVAANLATVINNACSAADALVSSNYSTPFIQPFPTLVRQASLIFACEALYRRRLNPGETNIFTKEADTYRSELRKAGNGMVSLDHATLKIVEPGFASFELSILDGPMY